MTSLLLNLKKFKKPSSNNFHSSIKSYKSTASTNPKPPKISKSIVLLGPNSAGKTTLLKQVCKAEYRFEPSNDYVTTLGANFYQKEVQKDNMIINIWDSTGTEINENILSHEIFKSCNCIILMFSYESSNAIEDLPKWIDFINSKQKFRKRLDGGRIPLIILLNKKDLKEKKFKKEDVSEIINEIYPTAYLDEIETKTKENVGEFFKALIELLNDRLEVSGLLIQENGEANSMGQSSQEMFLRSRKKSFRVINNDISIIKPKSNCC